MQGTEGKTPGLAELTLWLAKINKLRESTTGRVESVECWGESRTEGVCAGIVLHFLLRGGQPVPLADHAKPAPPAAFQRMLCRAEGSGLLLAKDCSDTVTDARAIQIPFQQRLPRAP